MPPTPFTLLTVTYNSAKPLRHHWAAGVPRGQRWIVVDNASSDNSVSVAKDLGAEVIPLDRNVGFGRANNIGARRIDTEFVSIVNPDVTVDFSTMPYLADQLRNNELLLAPQLAYPDGTPQPNGRGRPSLTNKVRHRISPRQSESDGYRIVAGPDEQVEVDWLMGAAISMRMESWEKLGGFDERFFVYYEDIDLGLRAAELGIRRVVDGAIRWTHGWAREASGFNLRGWKLEAASASKFYRKYPSLLVGTKNV
ncbi:glycosyltransferase [Microbacterium invictum]|uniref:Glycosyltransferase n=1 Tax=Microbacterium invictum TaxID=515415 RepID=A0ABZ0VAS6_9MICO|nr:glycosyltransferase [Microbacterium invictum]WQB69796.1 glycosyltransferase [Microbacterium invictum]